MDNWWMDDYVKNACSYAREVASVSPNVEQCTVESQVYVNDFEQQLNAAIGTESECNGIDFVGFRPGSANVSEANNAQEKPHWFLMVSLNQPTKMAGEWTMQYDDKKSNALPRQMYKEDFTRDLHTVARRLCRLVKNTGGTRR